MSHQVVATVTQSIMSHQVVATVTREHDEPLRSSNNNTRATAEPHQSNVACCMLRMNNNAQVPRHVTAAVLGEFLAHVVMIPTREYARVLQ